MRNHKPFDLEAELAALDAPPEEKPTESVESILSKIDQRESLKKHAAAREEQDAKPKTHYAEMNSEDFANTMKREGIADFPHPSIRRKPNVKDK